MSAVPGNIALPELPGPVDQHGVDKKPPIRATMYFFIVAALGLCGLPPFATSLGKGLMDQLKQVKTDGVEPLAHPLKVSNVFRDDAPAPSLRVDEALANAPDRHGDFFGVPAVLD